MSSLGDAAQAWLDYKAADAQMARIRAYPNPTRAMRADFERWSRRFSDARRRLDQILGVPQ